MLARETLEETGFRLLEAQQGVEALALAKKHRGAIHLLLIDVIMPEMGGPELADRMAAAHPEMKVLFMSGYDDSPIRHRGVLKSRMALLSKPFSPDVLVRKVLDALPRP